MAKRKQIEEKWGESSNDGEQPEAAAVEAPGERGVWVAECGASRQEFEALSDALRCVKHVLQRGGRAASIYRE